MDVQSTDNTNRLWSPYDVRIDLIQSLHESHPAIQRGMKGGLQVRLRFVVLAFSLCDRKG
jgi:hypothetical protein